MNFFSFYIQYKWWQIQVISLLEIDEFKISIYIELLIRQHCVSNAMLCYERIKAEALINLQWTLASSLRND